MALAASSTPNRSTPYITGIPYRTLTPVTITLTTGGGAGTMTAAQCLSGLLRVDCQDAQSLNFPTAAQIIAAIPGVEVGTTFELCVLNFGDTTLTMVVGAGMTNFTIGSVKAIMTLATFVEKRFTIRVTGITAQGGTDAVELYGHGSTTLAIG
jgi:hypothetical protein